MQRLARFLLGLVLVGSAQAQVVTRMGSDVQAMFASQSEGYKDSDPTGILWGLAGVGPYPTAAGIPSLPAAPTASITPPTGGNAFAGGGYSSFFNDLAGPGANTKAQSLIDDSVAATPFFTSDISIAIPAWRLFQGPSAAGYAYNQLNFGSNYLLTFNPGLATSTPGLPIYINGSVISGLGAYAQFDGVVNYTWLPVTINTAGLILPVGSPVLLGQLTYTFLQTGGGAFNTTLFSSGTLAPTPAGDGILALDGQMWIAGDPFDLQVTTVPEPSAFALLGFSLVGLIGYRAASKRQSRS
jgi:hypothetical protein